MKGVSYRLHIGGQSHLIRRCLNAFEDEVVPVLISKGVEEAEESVAARAELKFSSRPKADITISVAVIGLAIFVSQWAGKQLLDELFGESLKKGIRSCIDKTRKNLTLEREELVEYRSILCAEDDRPTVIIRALVKDEETLDQIIKNLNRAHAYAEQWLLTNGKQAPIHCYTVENGRLELNPVLYRTIEDIIPIAKILREWPATPKYELKE